MAKTKIDENELSNVSGGKSGNGQMCCPKCLKFVKVDDTKVREEGEGCDKTSYYKCPLCGHEWSV